MPKKGERVKVFIVHSTKAIYKSFYKKSFTLSIPLKSYLMELGNETYTIYHLYTLKKGFCKYNII